MSADWWAEFVETPQPLVAPSSKRSNAALNPGWKMQLQADGDVDDAFKAKLLRLFIAFRLPVQ